MCDAKTVTLERAVPRCADQYEKLLGPVYSSMVSDAEAAMARADTELEALGLPERAARVAIDLGALWYAPPAAGSTRL
jgi:hypothetical protein